MPLTLRFCTSCGADPQVRAGRPRPAFADGIEIRVYAKKADGGVGRGPGGPPHWQSKRHWAGAPAPPLKARYPAAGPVESRTTNSGSTTISASLTSFSAFGM